MQGATVAILSPGDMGHAVGATLRHNGARVITCLAGRSSRTAALAQAAGIEIVADDQTLVECADVILSILPPAGALALAERIAAAVHASGASPLVVDCNAIAPRTAATIGERFAGSGARFVDAGIIGPPPRPGSTTTHFYASGEHAADFAVLTGYGLDIRVLGERIGQASGFKMCYAALTKGLTALATEVLVAAQALGLSEALRAEQRSSQAMLLDWIERQVPGMPPKAYRWIGEMEEIATTFADLGLTPSLMLGAADLYRFVTATPLGHETPEARRLGQAAAETVTILADALGTEAPVHSHSGTSARAG